MAVKLVGKNIYQQLLYELDSINDLPDLKSNYCNGETGSMARVFNNGKLSYYYFTKPNKLWSEIIDAKNIANIESVSESDFNTLIF